MGTLLRKMRFAAVFISALALFTAGFASGSIEDTITKSFKVESGGQLNLVTDIGSIEVQAVEGNVLEVEVIRKARSISKRKAERIFEDFEVELDQRENDVYIKGEYKRIGWRRFWNRVGNRLKVKFLISVPKIYNVELKTSGGSISVSDLEGEVNSRTSGGSLRFNNIKGNILGRTSGGSIRIGEVDGNVDIHTSGGSIKILQAKGEVKAHTSGGSITVEKLIGAIKASSSGGSVRAYLSRQPESDCRLTTSGGSVTIYMAEDIGVNIDARTSGGRVRTEFPVKLQGYISKRSLKGELNGGGPELYLRSSGGSIYLRKK